MQRSQPHSVHTLAAATPHPPPPAHRLPPAAPDHSSHGTHVNDAKMTKNNPRRLTEGDVIRFGSKSKFKLTHAPLVLHAPADADATAAANALGLPLAPWGADVTTVVVREGGALGAAAAVALTMSVPVVTPGWIEAFTAQKVWAGQPPAPEAHAPRRLVLATPEGPRDVEVARWAPPASDALAGWVFAIRDEVGGCGALLGGVPLLASDQRSTITANNQPTNLNQNNPGHRPPRPGRGGRR
jgi:hypothetical protein